MCMWVCVCGHIHESAMDYSLVTNIFLFDYWPNECSIQLNVNDVFLCKSEYVVCNMPMPA